MMLVIELCHLSLGVAKDGEWLFSICSLATRLLDRTALGAKKESRERKVCVFGVRRPLRVLRQEKRAICTVTLFVFVWIYFVNV